MQNIDLENLEDIFSRMMQEDLQQFPLIDINGNGTKWSIMTNSFIFFIDQENDGLIGLQKIERGIKTLLGFKVQPKMSKFDLSKIKMLCEKCETANKSIEELYLTKKIDENFSTIDVWLALGGDPSQEAKKSAAWLEDLWRDNENNPSKTLRLKIEPKLEILQKILEEPKFKKERKKQKNAKTFDY